MRRSATIIREIKRNMGSLNEVQNKIYYVRTRRLKACTNKNGMGHPRG